MLIILVLLSVMNVSINAIPIPTSPSNVYVRVWARDVQTPAEDLRTTQNIVWSCITTVFACTWLAIHPDLPDSRRSSWSQFKHRIGLMVLTILAPEFILIWALRQRMGAHSIVKEYNSTIWGIDEGKKSWFRVLRAWFQDPSPPSDRQEWTLVHGFYVQMGGLLIHENDTDWPIRVLSFPELMDLIQSDLIDPPVIFENELCDKSKGDFFAKLFVVCQTTWFMLQCIVRWIVKLPMAELEIMAFSFAVLNIFTYAFWLEKPQNVSVGTRIQMKAQAKYIPHQNDTMFNPSPVHEMDITDSPQLASHTDPSGSPDDQGMEDGENTFGHDLHHLDPLPLKPAESSPTSEGVTQIDYWRNICLTFSILSRGLYLLGRGVLRAELFMQFRQIVLGCTPSRGRKSLVSTQTIRRGPSAEMTTIPFVMPGSITVESFSAYDPPGSEGKARVIIFVVAGGALFGGLHLIPWKFTFPTTAELLLWRVSALYTMVNPILLSFPLALFALLQNRSSERFNIRSVVIRWLRWVTLPVKVITIAIPLYILARLSIIVLAFTTLRSLQPDVYKNIPWNSYIPHI